MLVCLRTVTASQPLCVFLLQISEAFKRFGVGDSDDSVHVTVVHCRADCHLLADISSAVQGTQLPVEHLATLTDTTKVKKVRRSVIQPRC